MSHAHEKRALIDFFRSIGATAFDSDVVLFGNIARKLALDQSISDNSDIDIIFITDLDPHDVKRKLIIFSSDIMEEKLKLIGSRKTYDAGPAPSAAVTFDYQDKFCIDILVTKSTIPSEFLTSDVLKINNRGEPTIHSDHELEVEEVVTDLKRGKCRILRREVLDSRLYCRMGEALENNFMIYDAHDNMLTKRIERCPISMREFVFAVKLGCGHVISIESMSKAVRLCEPNLNKCPLCRREIYDILPFT